MDFCTNYILVWTRYFGLTIDSRPAKSTCLNGFWFWKITTDTFYAKRRFQFCANMVGGWGQICGFEMNSKWKRFFCFVVVSTFCCLGNPPEVYLFFSWWIRRWVCYFSLGMGSWAMLLSVPLVAWAPHLKCACYYYCYCYDL